MEPRQIVDKLVLVTLASFGFVAFLSFYNVSGGVFSSASGGAQVAAASTTAQPGGFTITKNTAPKLLSFGGVPGFKYTREIPPVIIQGGWRNYLMGGIQSYSCISPKGMFDTVSFSSCTRLLAPVVDNSNNKATFTQTTADTMPAYDRNYNGIFSAFVYNNATGAQQLFAIDHNENKGEAQPYIGSGKGPFLNSVSRTVTDLVPPQSTAAECTNENDGCYFAFVSASTVPYSTSTNWGQVPFTDLGPITWPSMGYVSADGTKKLSSGPRHPSAIVVGNYAYVYYTDWTWTYDTSNSDTGARAGGLKVIRAQLPNLGPGNWYAYYNGSFSEPALPAGYTIATEKNFFATPGPRATILVPNKVSPGTGNPEDIAFSVAHVTGQNLYLGVEEYQDYGLESTSACSGTANNIGLALRYSTDLVNWSTRVPLITCKSYTAFNMHYPKFVNASSTSNTEIDLSNFYIVGSHSPSAGSFDYYDVNVSATMPVVSTSTAH